MAWNDDYTRSLTAFANSRGIDPVQLATYISYETGGTFDPWQKGPTTKWGEHRGLIQMGKEQRDRYGYSQNGTPDEQFAAIGRYLDASGYKQGMSPEQLYATINAGNPNALGARDAAAGGAPGTVLDKVNTQMGPHRQKALARLGLDPDLPTPDAVPVSTSGGGTGFVVPGQGGRITSPPGLPVVPEDQTYKTDFAKGGPLAAFGMGQKDYDFGDALGGAATALMAIDNPQGAQVLASSYRKEKQEKRTASPWKMQSYNPATGKGFYINEQTGQVQEAQFGTPYREMSNAERTSFDEADDNIAINANIIAQAQKFQKMIADKQIDLSLPARGADWFNSLTDQSKEVGRNTQAYLQWRDGLANDLLRLNKGTQTDRDYANTLKELSPGLSKFDNRSTFTALDAITEKARNQLGRQINRQNSIISEFGEQAPRGDYRERYSAYGPRFDKATQDFSAQRQQYLSGQDAASQAAASQPDPRVAPARSGGGTLSPRAQAIKDAYNRQ